MKLSTFMSIAAVLAFLFGVAFLILPVQLMSLYGVSLHPSGEYIARYLGSAFVGVACLTWVARFASPNGQGMRAIILGNFILSITGFIVSMFNKFYGVGNELVWSTVVIYFLLAVGFGYFNFKKSRH